jgi:hypothetical protein
MQIGFKIVCLIIVSLCDYGHGHQWAPLLDSRMSFRIPKSIGLDWNDPREGHVNVTGKDPLLGDEQMNGQLFRISERNEQDTIIPDIERQYHRFLLSYYLGC